MKRKVFQDHNTIMNSLRTVTNKLLQNSSSSVLFKGSKPGILLPSQFAANNVAGQGWHVNTEVKTSNIKEAGNGR